MAVTALSKGVIMQFAHRKLLILQGAAERAQAVEMAAEAAFSTRGSVNAENRWQLAGSGLEANVRHALSSRIPQVRQVS
jgi:hypothetical protein